MKVTAASYADLAKRLREAEKVIEEDGRELERLYRHRAWLLDWARSMVDTPGREGGRALIVAIEKETAT